MGDVLTSEPQTLASARYWTAIAIQNQANVNSICCGYKPLCLLGQLPTVTVSTQHHEEVRHKAEHKKKGDWYWYADRGAITRCSPDTEHLSISYTNAITGNVSLGVFG